MAFYPRTGSPQTTTQSAIAPATSTQQSQFSLLGFVETLFADIINFLSSITGRTPIPTGQSQSAIQTPIAVVKIPKPTISASAAITQAIATETNLNPRDFKTGWYLASNPAWQAEVQNAHIDFQEASNGTCGGVSSPDLTFAQASSLGLQGGQTGIKIATGLGVAIPGLVSNVVLPGVGAVIAIISTIFQHHAANVARDNRAICSLLPASNNAFKAIIEGVQSQQLTPQQGEAAMDAIPAQFLAQAGAAKNNSPYCNALCEYLIRVRAIAFYWKSQFASME